MKANTAAVTIILVQAAVAITVEEAAVKILTFRYCFANHSRWAGRAGWSGEHVAKKGHEEEQKIFSTTADLAYTTSCVTDTCRTTLLL